MLININYIYVVISKILNDMKKSIFSALCLVLLATTTQSAWGAEVIVLYHEGFGNNPNSARVWNDSYKEQSGVSAVYSSASYTITGAKQSKNTMGSTNSALIQSTAGTDAIFIVGPLNVASYTSLQVTYKWKAASIKGTYNTSLAYATASNGTYTNVTKTSGEGATTFVDVKYDLPAAAQVSTLYLKVIVNTSNTQAVLDELELTGIAGSTEPTVYLGLFLAAFVAVRACVRRVECLYATFHHIIMSKIDFRSVHFAKALFVSFLGFVLFLSIKCRFLSFFLANMCKSASLRWCA